MEKRPKILFTTPYKPYPKTPIAQDNTDFFYYRNTLGQGIFRIKQIHNWHPLHFLAQNLPVYSIVLENPTFSRLKQEIKTGGYNIVAITFTIVSTDRVLEIVRWIKEMYPSMEIILGGYGTAIFSESFNPEHELYNAVDAVCYGEGLLFIKNYLKEKWKIQCDQPVKQNLLPSYHCLCRTRIPYFKQLSFIHSIGCKNRCSFCATSNQFKGKKIYLCSYKELYHHIRENAYKNRSVTSGIIYNENFLENRDGVLEFMNLIKNDKELQSRPLLFTIFSSVQSIIQYSIEELLMCNIGTIYIGVESFRKDILENEKLVKRNNPADIRKLFKDLHDAGISTLGSMIIGWDDHTKGNIEKELENFILLEPVFYQVMPLHPVPGTELWKKTKAENRIIKNYQYSEDGVVKLNMHYKHFTHDTINKYIEKAYSELVSHGGPWPFRVYRVLSCGYTSFRNRKEDFYKIRSLGYKRIMNRLLPLVIISGLFCKGKRFSFQWQNLVKDMLHQSVLKFFISVLISLFFFLFLIIVYSGGKLLSWLRPSGDQPDTIRRMYK